MSEQIIKTINELQLVSVMNKTKWRSLAEGIQSEDGLFPMVREKIIGTVEKPTEFSGYDWECLRLGSTSYIEWLEIDPIQKTRIGSLVSEKETDCSEAIKRILVKYNIPYTIEGNCFRIWGYISSDNRPDFV